MGPCVGQSPLCFDFFASVLILQPFCDLRLQLLSGSLQSLLQLCLDFAFLRFQLTGQLPDHVRLTLGLSLNSLDLAARLRFGLLHCLAFDPRAFLTELPVRLLAQLGSFRTKPLGKVALQIRSDLLRQKFGNRYSAATVWTGDYVGTHRWLLS